MNILGISAFYHDSAACLLRDGEIVAAAQEERFTRKKHDAGFPANAVRYCLAEGGVPRTARRGRLLRQADHQVRAHPRDLLRRGPAGLRPFMMAMPLWLREKLWIPAEIESALEDAGAGRARETLLPRAPRVPRRQRLLPLPLRERRDPDLDGVGEWATSTLGHGQGNRIEILEEMHFPHSLGLLYSAFTYFTGFRVNSGEYKLMGLAPYGEPRTSTRSATT